MTDYEMIVKYHQGDDKEKEIITLKLFMKYTPLIKSKLKRWNFDNISYIGDAEDAYQEFYLTMPKIINSVNIILIPETFNFSVYLITSLKYFYSGLLNASNLQKRKIDKVSITYSKLDQDIIYSDQAEFFGKDYYESASKLDPAVTYSNTEAHALYQQFKKQNEYKELNYLESPNYKTNKEICKELKCSEPLFNYHKKKIQKHFISYMKENGYFSDYDYYIA